MTTSRRSLLRAAALAPAVVGLTHPRSLFGGEVSAMAAEGLAVPAEGMRLDGRGLVGFSLSWAADGHDSPVAQVRSRTAGGWQPWIAVAADRGHGPEDAERDHGPAVLVVDAVEHEIVVVPGTVDARVHPLAGTAADTSGPVGYAAGSLTVITPLPGLEIIERSNWTTEPRRPTWDCVIRSSLFGAGCRADVGLRHALVHHTVNTNDYAQSSVPAMLTGIMRYHVDTRGWDDIAYNFVVDRWGRIWHARDSDPYEPIAGGHTTGLNAESVGVAVLGDFTSTAPDQAVVDSIGRLLGWKLGMHGVDPLGMNTVRSSGGDYADPGEWVQLHNIAGHRDHQITGCPGNHLYSRMADIRTAAAELVPVFGYVGPRYHLDRIDLEGWAIDRFSPGTTVDVDVAVDGEAVSHKADVNVSNLTIDEFDLARYDLDHADAGRKHGLKLTVPIDLDTTSVVVTAHASDDRTATLVNLRLFATFVDVEPGHYYSDAVYWLRETELTTGTQPGLFEPKDRLDRGQMAAFLWRFMDRPEVSRATPFTDVEDDAYYAAAVRWLHAEGITTGTGPTSYSPGEFVTRGQMATFLWRLCGRIKPSTPTTFTDLVPGAYYERAVQWLHETGITTGVSPTEFAPDRQIIREEMATFLRRLATTPEAWTVTEPSSFVDLPAT